MFGLFTKKETVTEIKSQEELSGPFFPMVDVATAFSYVTVAHDGKEISLSMKTDTVQESKWALEEVSLLQKTARAIKKEYKADMTELRQSFQNTVSNRGAMIPGGGKVGTLLRFAVRSNRAAQRGSISDQLLAVQRSVIDPIDDIILACDKLKLILKKEIIAG